LEPSHAIYYAVKKLAPKINKNKIIAVCLSGRGDKDKDIIKNEPHR
ncbi:MAG: tryptophan synthase subunit beta, partial [Candidatus Omnitrophica bacterium]|nr:tryptophan synthase subunit beta [Candidatus Omnitrophota bacterium]